MARNFGAMKLWVMGATAPSALASAESGMETLKEPSVTRHAFKVHMTAADTQALKRCI